VRSPLNRDNNPLLRKQLDAILDKEFIRDHARMVRCTPVSKL
jgi:hypothetical protein